MDKNEGLRGHIRTRRRFIHPLLLAPLHCKFGHELPVQRAERPLGGVARGPEGLRLLGLLRPLHAIAATSSAMAQLHAHRRDAFSAAMASDGGIDRSIEPKNICVKASYSLRRGRVGHVDIWVDRQHRLIILVRDDDDQIVLLQPLQNLLEELGVRRRFFSDLVRVRFEVPVDHS